MKLDGCELICEIDLLKTGGLHQPVKLLEQRLIGRGVKVSEIHLGRIHSRYLLPPK